MVMPRTLVGGGVSGLHMRSQKKSRNYTKNSFQYEFILILCVSIDVQH